VPSIAAWRVRATGASANRAKRPASSFASATGPVLQSTSVLPAGTAAATSRTSASPGRDIGAPMTPRPMNPIAEAFVISQKAL
jgi:hypothetical protein